MANDQQLSPVPDKLTKAIGLGMNEEEYRRVCAILDREPTDTELAMYSVEWSEHCGYPRSRLLLRLLPKTGKYPALVGEDAGGFEIEPGLAVVFKMESHNHPSQVEPKHGAATGIGGIVRDIFASGARPIACLDSLRFGSLDEPRARYLFRGVVDGIQFYGNCIGVPTVAGEVAFNPCYRGNCLVGAMCVGVVRTEDLASGKARGAGNPVLYFGNATGRDGIGGCSILASHEFGKDDAKRPTVQIGDPFTEKCLIEATLEALATGAIISIKDMGAAGLTCTTCEQAAAGGIGMDIDLAKVPLREADMEPYEIMMSESQERMLAVVERGREEEAAAVIRKWGLNAVVIGETLADGAMRVRRDGEIIADMPAASLADPPLYDLPTEEPEYLQQTRGYDIASLPLPADGNAVLLTLLKSPTIADKSWVYRQYDHTVQTNTVVLPGKGDAAVLRIKQSAHRAIAVTADCNDRYCYLDPYVGAQIAIAESARNVVCTGADPAGVTDCLCFGNPEKPDRYWQFKRAIEGLADACRAFELPVVSGNVSLYNETAESVIHPSPLIGLVGVLDDVSHATELTFRDEGDVIFLIGDTFDELGGSEYLYACHGLEVGLPPALDLLRERAVQQTCLVAIRAGIVKSAHDCADGGLAVALAESCIAGGRGAEVDAGAAAASAIRWDSLLFGESQSRIVVTVAPGDADKLRRLSAEAGASLHELGRVTGNDLRIRADGTVRIDQPVDRLDAEWRGAIPCLMSV